MSTLTVPVAVIEDLDTHPNADALEIATVLGWTTVVRKGTYKPGDRVVYIPVDSVLPVELSDRLGVTQYLSKGRVRAARLRGVKSFGLVIKPRYRWKVGRNVADFYGITKFEPPVRVIGGSGGTVRQRPELSLFPRYTDVENLRHYPQVFEPGERVVITEKIHGTNSRVGFVDGEFVAGSRRLRRAEPEAYESRVAHFELEGVPQDAGVAVTVDGLLQYITDFSDTYWWPLTIPAVRELLLSTYAEYEARSVVLYGEIYGSSVQSFDYGVRGALGYRAFDLQVNGVYLDFDEFERRCMDAGVDTAPVLHDGAYDLEKVKSLSEGTSLIGGNHIREGVVVRPFRERTHPNVGRVLLKYVSDDYLLAKNVSDSTDL